LIPRPGIESQRDVKVKLPEPHQPGAALRLLDQRAELLVRSACLQVAEQRPGVRPADAAEDAVQNVCERPFAFDGVAANRNLEHLFGCHRFPSFSLA
jgi:hypothetical protein